MPEVRIKVGASVDSSVRVVFRPLVQAARDARRHIQNEFAGAAREVNKAFAVSAKGVEAALRGVERSGSGSARRMAKEIDRTAREMQRGFGQIGKVAEREFNRAERASRRAGGTFARDVAVKSTHFLAPRAPVLSRGARVGGDILRGAGVETQVASLVARVAEQEDLAAKIAILAFRPGEKGIVGQRLDPSKLTSQAREMGAEFGIDPTDALRGLDSFVAQSGDIEAGLKLWREIAMLAKSQNASMESVFMNAGKVNSIFDAQKLTMGDVNTRVRAVSASMAGVVGSTKTGPIEMEKLAKELPKLSGMAGLFADPARAIGELVALTQIAEGGQGPNAATSATQVQNLALAVMTPRKVEAMKRVFGMKDEDIRDPETGGLQPLKTILAQLIISSKGKEDEIRGKVLKDKREFMPILDLLGINRGAGGNTNPVAGLKAILERFDELMKPIGQQQVAGDLAVQMGLMSTQAMQFNAELDRVAADALPGVIKAFRQLAPDALKLASALGGFANFVANNLGTSIAVAVSASIARAGIESTIQAGITKLILGSGGATGTQAGAVGSAMGKLGAGLAITAYGVTIASMGLLAIESVGDSVEAGRQSVRTTEQEALNAANIARAKLRAGTADAGTQKELESERARLQALIARGETRQEASGVSNAFADLGRAASGETNKIGLGKEALESLDSLKASLKLVNDTIQAVASRPLKVTVGNANAVDPSKRKAQ